MNPNMTLSRAIEAETNTVRACYYCITIVIVMRKESRIYNTESAGQIPGHLSSTLQDSIRLLDQSARITASQAQEAHSLAGSTIHLNSLDIYSLHRITNEFTEVTRVLDDTANTLRNAAELSIIAYLASLGGQGGANICDGSQLQRILSHFDKQIRSIVRGVLNNSSYGNCVLWKIAEECYNQATSYSGALHPDNYFVEREEAYLEWPYDPDFEAEEYYEHENRLAVDDDYAKAFSEQIEHRRGKSKRKEQSWVDFWVLVLNRCPGGPTLFYPRASYEVKLLKFATTDIPPYLFRTFDGKSSGRNDDNVIASMTSVSRSPGDSRIDLLSLPTDRATDMIYTHLTKQCCGGEDPDNLMSWTSSLLFAIQYAIWRCRTFHCHPADIKICAVDTRRFPHGQFAPDMWLLQAYRHFAAQVGGETQKFFRFRLEDERYYNGEYLSQGSVNHASRSCVVSLESLEESGVYDLYPEFAEVQGMEKWTNRVLELRQGWSIEQRTTPQKIQLASMVTMKCFNNFETIDMVLILLSFKARKIRGDPRDNNKYGPEWSRRPDEVRRYASTAELLKSRNQSMNGWGDASLHLLNNSFDIQMVKEIFDCT
ncbi:hypothetical protein G7Y89_g10810 [Cudoniella acicularis]|uniref:DUF7587 domain-containing protein n=1 Tax=Cudoniella acicularis TaxID=354080 RepID=A0A8H4W0K8_9HELO|nr:hypothetical protein G7Y89_g10810 [Cudoniella acicularis]